MNFRLMFFGLLVYVLLLFPFTAKAADYIVAGASVTDTNGLYVEDGTSDGVSKYTMGGWTLAREQPMGAAWMIRNGPDTFNDLIYVNWTFPSPDLPPNDGNWAEWNGGGAAPSLTITISENNPPPEVNYNYYLPYYSSANNYWTGLALINRNQKDSTQVQITVYGSNGNPLAIENKAIPAYGQDAFPVASQLNASGWMQVNSQQPLSGLAFLGSGGTPSLMADIPFVSELSTCLAVPHVAQDDTWDTVILTCNPNNVAVSITLKYVDKAGVVQGTQNYSIPAFGSGEYPLSTNFSNNIPMAGRVEISSSAGIATFALYSNRKSGGTYYSGINAGSCE